MAVSRMALLESRLVALETEVEQLKVQSVNGHGTAPEDWVDKMYGLFADYPDFDKVVELGRKYRESLRPTVRKPTRKAKVKK